MHRYDMVTGEHQTVFYDLDYKINAIYLMGDTVLLNGGIYTHNDNGYVTSNDYMMLADIDEEGNFVNVRILK